MRIISFNIIPEIAADKGPFGVRLPCGPVGGRQFLEDAAVQLEHLWVEHDDSIDVVSDVIRFVDWAGGWCQWLHPSS
jgi:hypothetical protein